MSNPVDDDDMFALRDEEGDDDGPGALPGPRQGETTIQAAAAEYMAQLTQHLPHPDDADAWAQREAADRDRIAAAARERAMLAMERRSRHLRSSGIDWPARLVDDALAASDQRPLMLRVASFGAPPRSAGSRNVLVLEGGVGTGKSTAATWWALRFGGDAPVYIRSATFEGEGRYDKAVRAKIREASAIVLDDLGAEFKDGRGNLIAALDELIDIVYSQRLPAVITTNLTGEAFKARYGKEGERMRSRLRGCARWSSVNSADLRQPA